MKQPFMIWVNRSHLQRTHNSSTRTKEQTNILANFFAIRASSKLNKTLQWRHNERDSVSNHQPHDFLLNRLFRRRSRKTPKLRVTDLCTRNSPVTDDFPAQMPSNAKIVSIWWRNPIVRKLHYEIYHCVYMLFLLGWPPCQRSYMTLMEVSQRALDSLYIRNIWLLYIGVFFL